MRLLSPPTAHHSTFKLVLPLAALALCCAPAAMARPIQRCVQKTGRGRAARAERCVAAARLREKCQSRAISRVREQAGAIHPYRRRANLHRNDTVWRPGNRFLDRHLQYGTQHPGQSKYQRERQGLSDRNLGPPGHGVRAPGNRCQREHD